MLVDHLRRVPAAAGDPADSCAVAPGQDANAGPARLDSDALSEMANFSSPTPSDDSGGRLSESTWMGRAPKGEIPTSDNPYYIHPEMPLRLTWDACSLVLVFLVAVFVPIECAFFVFDSEKPGFFAFFDTLTDVFFMLDIGLNFVTAYHQGHGLSGRLVTDFPSMAGNYARGWFTIDLVASFPWEDVARGLVLDNSDSGSVAGLEGLRLCRLVKGLKLLRIGNLLRVVEDQMLAAHSLTVAFQLCKMTLIVLVVLHDFACFWAAVAIWQSGGDDPTWFQKVGLENETRERQYIASLYFIVTTGTTVGYGDICPQNTIERAIDTVLLFMLAGFVTQFLTTFSVMLTSINKIQHQLARAKQDALVLMRKRHVPRDLQVKVLRYVEEAWKEEAITALDSQVMRLLSESLQEQLAVAVKGSVLKRFPFLRGVDPDFLTAVCKVCRTQCAAEGDVVVREDAPAHDMFFMVRGEAEILRRGISIGGLRTGDWFGEICLFLPGAVRTATVRCLANSEFVVLNQKDFRRKLHHFPEVRALADRLTEALKVGDMATFRRLAFAGRSPNPLTSALRSAAAAGAPVAGRLVSEARARP